MRRDRITVPELCGIVRALKKKGNPEYTGNSRSILHLETKDMKDCRRDAPEVDCCQIGPGPGEPNQPKAPLSP